MTPDDQLQAALLNGGHDQPERMALRAGPLSAVFEAGTLRYLRWGEHEVVRGIYAAVRDLSWGTILGVLHDVQVDVEDDHFHITFTSEHRGNDGEDKIAYTWRGTIIGTKEGEITFSFDGEAGSSFKRNRIGFCILHPMSVAGARCTVEQVDGQWIEGEFPRLISPHQPFLNIRAITHEVTPQVACEVRMTGDTFEMEDQRNWTDASFKTYCTPLVIPYPARVSTGDRVEQRITVRLHGATELPPATTTPDNTNLWARVEDETVVRLPNLGLAYGEAAGRLTEGEIARLRALHLSHLRFDWYGDEEDLQQVAREAVAIGAPLQLVLHLPADHEAVDAVLRSAQASVDALTNAHDQSLIKHWVIFRDGAATTSPETVRLAHDHLVEVPLVGGTDAFFTDLNRFRPPADLLDGVIYSCNPQVHAFDNASLVETLPTQALTVESARAFSEDKPIHVGPITLKMRWNPSAAGEAAAALEGELPDNADTRQMSLFAAGWTLGSIKSLALGGATSATYYELVGWRGIMAGENGTPLDVFPAAPGMLYPVYFILLQLADFGEGTLTPIRFDDPLRAQGFVLKQASRQRIFLANLTEQATTFTLEGLAGKYTLRRLNVENALAASASPVAWAEGGEAFALGEAGEIALQAYEVVFLDGE